MMRQIESGGIPEASSVNATTGPKASPSPCMPNTSEVSAPRFLALAYSDISTALIG